MPRRTRAARARTHAADSGAVGSARRDSSESLWLRLNLSLFYSQVQWRAHAKGVTWVRQVCGPAGQEGCKGRQAYHRAHAWACILDLLQQQALPRFSRHSRLRSEGERPDVSDLPHDDTLIRCRAANARVGGTKPGGHAYTPQRRSRRRTRSKACGGASSRVVGRTSSTVFSGIAPLGSPVRCRTSTVSSNGVDTDACVAACQACPACHQHPAHSAATRQLTAADL